MANEFYADSGAPAPGATGASATIRAEFASIEDAFDKLPTLTANADLPIFVNSGATALEAVTAAQARAKLGITLGSDVQPYDADLTAIAALTSAADKLPYSTGAQAWALTPFTAAARALLDDADATAMRATLGIAIGTNIQAWDADLDAIAALSSAANKLPYATGAGAWALADLTAFARTLLDDADAATMRTTLGAASTTNASTSAAGIVPLATSAEAVTGTDALKALTPATLRNGLNATGTAPIYAIRAWAACNSTGTILASGNVSSVTYHATGDYTANFATAMPHANYAAMGIVEEGGDRFITGGSAAGAATKTTSAYRFNIKNSAASSFDQSFSMSFVC